MSFVGTALGLASRLVVALWIAAYLGWEALAPALQPAAREVTARVTPLRETPPEPPSPLRGTPPESPPSEPAVAAPESPAPEPASSQPAREAVPRAVAAGDVGAGAALLSGSGAFPVFTSRYDDFGSFGDYAGAMARLGARFVVVRQRRIVGSIDPGTGAVEPFEHDGRFSPRARDYAGEPGLAPLSRAARASFGEGAVVMMLVPWRIDAGLFGGIARALAEQGRGHQDFRELRGRYEQGPGGELQIRVDAGTLHDGGREPMDLLFDLGALARSADPAA